MSAGELGSDANQQTQKFTFVSDSSPSNKPKNTEGSIPCLFLDRPMKKVERDIQFHTKQVDLDDIHSMHSGAACSGYDNQSYHSNPALNDGVSEISVTRGITLSQASKQSTRTCVQD